ncbi:unnamed protein product [Calicophoron daubneyi]|uniref:Nuclear pore complex protein n=1 Tax=Calicophoron daubneyi TaxID=300641 RepID=A0AAV2TJX3_CALDB
MTLSGTLNNRNSSFRTTMCLGPDDSRGDLGASGPLKDRSANSDVILLNNYVDKNPASLTNVTLLLDEEPTIFDSSDLFDRFHAILSDENVSPVDLPLQYSKVCAQTARSLPKIAANALYCDSLPNVKNLLDLLNLEKDTWALISALYTDRFESGYKGDGNELKDFSAVQHSEREIINLLYEKDSALRETQMLIDWLERRVREQIEEVAERYECLFNQNLTWENTAQMLDCLPASELRSRRLITELHPDAIYRGGAHLDPNDETDDDRYLNYLFLCIRGGDMQRAQRLCMQRGEFWRAISLEGWRPFHFTGFTDIPSQADLLSGENMELDSEWVDVQMPGGLQQVKSRPGPQASSNYVEGNASRVLFRSVCWWNAENTKLRPYERAIYASMSGNLSVLTRTLPASWADLTWAHCRALIEAQVDSRLRSLLRTGPRSDTLAVTGKTTVWPLDGGISLPDSAWMAKTWSLGETFAKIDSCLGWSALSCLKNSTELSMEKMRSSALNNFLNGDANVPCDSGRPTGKGFGDELSIPVILYCLFYAAHQALMLREYDAYLDAAASVMPRLVAASLGTSESGNSAPSGTLRPPGLLKSGTKDPVVCHALRFMAHLVLFLKAVEPDIQDEPCAQILKAYLSVLIVDHRIDLIADYTATLPSINMRIDWYSAFLTDITIPAERERCLTLASSAGFDIQRLTRAVVRLLRQRQPVPMFDPLSNGGAMTLVDSTLSTGLASLLQEEKLGKLTETDRMRILAMDWLFYDPRQRGEALVVANSLLRVFVAMNCLKAAQQVLSKLPLGTLGHAKMICTNLGPPIWLLNTIREHECLVMYLDSQEAFADWFKQAHSKRPIAPPDTGTSVSNVYGTRGLTQRLQAEEAKKSYEAQLERWHHELQLDTDVSYTELFVSFHR